MRLVGAEVTHAVFGKGTIVSLENGYLQVCFPNADQPKKFVYPDAFDGFLLLEGAEKERVALELRQKKAERQRQEELLSSLNRIGPTAPGCHPGKKRRPFSPNRRKTAEG